METNPNTVVVKEQPRRRRFVGVIGCISLGAALVAGATMAAFTDRESAVFGDENGISTAKHNIQIRQDANDTWKDTEGDNHGEDPSQAAPIVLDLAGGPLMPGDTNTAYTASFQVRNDTASQTSNLKLHLENVLAPTADGYLDPTGDMAGWLQFDISVKSGSTTTPYTGKTFAGLSGLNKAITFATSAAPGAEFTITVKINLDGQADSSAANWDLKLKAVVTGQAVAS